MTDRVQKIREKVVWLMSNHDSALDYEAALEDVLNIIDSMQEEPVIEDLELAATKYAQDKYMPVQTSQAFKAGAKWKEAKDQEITETAIHHAYHNGRLEMKEQIMKNIWKSANGDDLPIIDREVIALLDNGKVVFAHRPPEFWDGKDIITGKVTRNYPKTYDKGGWNIPDIKFWLDVELPKEIEL